MSLADRLVLSPEFKIRTSRAITLDRAIERIDSAYPGVEKRPADDVSVKMAKVEAALQVNDWSGVSSGDMSVAVFANIKGGAHLSVELRDFLGREMEATTNPLLLDAMCRGYLVGWASGNNETRTLASRLVTKAQLLPARWKNLFSKCPDFLDAENGCTVVGALMVDAHSPYSWLKEIGLPSPHDDGFMRQAHLEFLRQSPEAKSAPEVDKLLAWASPLGKTEMLDTRAEEVVREILSPWVSRDCPQELREHCVDRLLKRFGDPRKEHQAFWAQIGESQRSVMLKWLAGKSMEAIFEIVTLAEQGSEHGHQWAKRRRFWMGIYNKGRIDEAWVALGNKAIPYAKDLYQRTGDPSFMSYGRQSRRDTCLLFMKIGNKTIVEGSHNFRVHVFPTPSRKTPSLYANNYDLQEIMLPKQHSDARVHDSGDNWMGWVQRRISR
jgi:hypothetical protein